MAISRYNRERYYDPTPYEALSKIEQEERRSRQKPLVFICSPFAGDVAQNVSNAQRYSHLAVKQGAIPFAPHLLFPQFMDDKDEKQRNLALSFGMVLLSKCDEIWVFGGEITSGMRREINCAKSLGIMIRYFQTNGMEVK